MDFENSKSQIAILVLNQCSISAGFPKVWFAGDQKTALTGESLYYIVTYIHRPTKKVGKSQKVLSLAFHMFKLHTVIVGTYLFSLHKLIRGLAKQLITSISNYYYCDYSKFNPR